ncbi:site-specific integrase [Vibrio parahaemolyticus]
MKQAHYNDLTPRTTENYFTDIDNHQQYFLSEAQLTCLISSYERKAVPLSDNKFSEGTWRIKDRGGNKLVSLTFEDYTNYTFIGSAKQSKYKYLMLFLKIHTFHALLEEAANGEPLSARTIAGKLGHARKYLTQLMIDNNILILNTNEVGNLTIRSPMALSSADIDDLIEEIIGRTDIEEKSKCDILSGIELYLRERLDIPTFYCIPHNPFRFASINSFVDVQEDDNAWDGERGFHIIPETEYYWIGQSALQFIHDHGETILNLQDVTIDVLKTKLPIDIKRKQTRVASTNKHRGFNPTDWRVLEIARRIQAGEATLPIWTDEQQLRWNITNIELPESLTGDLAHLEVHNSGFNMHYLYGLFRLLYAACSTIIFIPTGIRASEFANLTEDRICNEPNDDGIYTYINGIKKIRRPGRFRNDNEIPIPVETWYAMKMLARLTKPIRGDDQRLFFPPVSIGTVGSAQQIDNDRTISKWQAVPMFPNTINRYLAYFASFIGSKEAPTSHQFRKTLANFFLSRTTHAPLLLRQLFGHKSLGMTIKYLRKNNLIKQAVANRVIEQFGDTVAALATSYITDTLGGPMKETFKKAILSRERFHGVAEHQLALDIRNWLLERMKSQQYILTHTPVSLCCRQKSAKDIPPCHTGNCINVHADQNEFPVPADCVGAECEWALYTFKDAEKLTANMVQYREVLEAIGPDTAMHQRFRSYASSYLETYDPLLKQIIKVPAEHIEHKMQVIFSAKLTEENVA